MKKYLDDSNSIQTNNMSSLRSPNVKNIELTKDNSKKYNKNNSNTINLNNVPTVYYDSKTGKYTGGTGKEEILLTTQKTNKKEVNDIKPIEIEGIDQEDYEKKLKEVKEKYQEKENININNLNITLDKINERISKIESELFYYDRGEVAAVSVEGKESPEELKNREIAQKVQKLEEELKSLYKDKQIIETTLKKYNQTLNLASYDLLRDYDSYRNFEEPTAKLSKEEWIKIFDNSKWETSDGIPNINYQHCLDAYGENAPSPLEFIRKAKEIYDGNKNGLENGVRVLGYTGIGEKNYETLELMIELEKTNPEMSKMYNYIYKEKGLEEANKYLEVVRETVNQSVGEQRASEFLKTLENNPDAKLAIINHLKTTIKGLGDGVESWNDGLEAWSNSTDITLANEYESMYILMALSSKKNKELSGCIQNGKSLSDLIDYTKDYGALLDKNYKYSQAIGNMLPSMAISLINPTAGSIVLGTSAGGQSYHQALVEGYENNQALIYGLTTGLTAAGLEKLLGAIPGLGNKELATEGILKKMFSEGVEEGLEQITQSVLWDQLILGKEVNLDELGHDSLESFIDGAIISGILNSPSSISKGINFVYNKVNYKLSYDQINEMILKIDEGELKEEVFCDMTGIDPGFDTYIEEAKLILTDKLGLNDKKTGLDYNLQFFASSEENNQKQNFLSRIYNKKSSNILELTQEEKKLSKEINNYIKQNGPVIVSFKDTTQFSTAFLNSIEDLSSLKIRINGGFEDINGNFKSKYNSSKYLDRITYTGYEALAISQKLDELTSMVDMTLPVAARAEQIYNILSTNVPVMYNYAQIPEGHKISASLRGLTNVNSAAQAGLVCAGYSQAYKELCTRCGIKCDYIRGLAYSDYLRQGKPGGHAWNVVIDGNNYIPVDVTWHASSGKNWFGRSNEFAARHVADADEMFQNFDLQKSDNSFSNEEKIIKALNFHDSKYGEGSGIKSLEKYLEDGNINHISSNGGARDIINSISENELKSYVKQYKDTENINYIVNIMSQKYGYQNAIFQLNKYVETGNVNLITRTGGARDLIQQIDIKILENMLGGL